MKCATPPRIVPMSKGSLNFGITFDRYCRQRASASQVCSERFLQREASQTGVCGKESRDPVAEENFTKRVPPTIVRLLYCAIWYTGGKTAWRDDARPTRAAGSKQSDEKH
jgi:hypothetical protein